MLNDACASRFKKVYLAPASRISAVGSMVWHPSSAFSIRLIHMIRIRSSSSVEEGMTGSKRFCGKVTGSFSCTKD